ncbi:MAG: hypothetical protein HY554_03225 [Elusimicrobia bacterium]|nr:hypothetical protein [Elusimicrobiota bacterium]
MRGRLALSALLGLLLGAPSGAGASCGADSCAASPEASHAAAARRLRLSYGFEYLEADRARLGRGSVAIGQVRGHHDEHYSVTRIHRVGLSAGLLERLGLDLSLPVVVRSHGHIHNHRGGRLWNQWHAAGVGDVTAVARARAFQGEGRWPSVYALVGGKLPSGRTGPFVSEGDERADAEPTVTPGTGSWDAIVGLALAHSLADIPITAGVRYQLNGPSAQGYRIGNVLDAMAGLRYPILHGVGAMAQANLRIKGRDYRGATREETERTGGEFLYLSPGVDWMLTDAVSVYAMAQFPVYQRVNSIQLVPAYGLMAGTAWEFGF